MADRDTAYNRVCFAYMAALKRATVCWWFHRWHRHLRWFHRGHRHRNGGWTLYFCWACKDREFGRRHMARLERRELQQIAGHR